MSNKIPEAITHRKIMQPKVTCPNRPDPKKYKANMLIYLSENEIKDFITNKFQDEFGYCGAAIGEKKIILNSGDGNIKINITWGSEDTLADVKAQPIKEDTTEGKEKEWENIFTEIDGFIGLFELLLSDDSLTFDQQEAIDRIEKFRLDLVAIRDKAPSPRVSEEEKEYYGSMLLPPCNCRTPVRKLCDNENTSYNDCVGNLLNDKCPDGKAKPEEQSEKKEDISCHTICNKEDEKGNWKKKMDNNINRIDELLAEGDEHLRKAKEGITEILDKKIGEPEEKSEEKDIDYGPLKCWDGPIACIECRTGKYLKRLDDTEGGIGENYENFKCMNCEGIIHIELPD